MASVLTRCVRFDPVRNKTKQLQRMSRIKICLCLQSSYLQFFWRSGDVKFASFASLLSSKAACRPRRRLGLNGGLHERVTFAFVSSTKGCEGRTFVFCRYDSAVIMTRKIFFVGKSSSRPNDGLVK